MTTASGSSAEIEAYLAAVRASLSDIAEDERADLLAEVEASLVEAAGEGDRPIASLGPPEEFAAELRASAGLGEPTGPRRRRAARRPCARWWSSSGHGPSRVPRCASGASSRRPGGSSAASCSSPPSRP